MNQLLTVQIDKVYFDPETLRPLGSMSEHHPPLSLQEAASLLATYGFLLVDPTVRSVRSGRIDNRTWQMIRVTPNHLS